MVFQRFHIPRPMLLVQWRVLREVLGVFFVALLGVTAVILLAATVIFLRRLPGVELRDLLYVMPLLGAYMSVYTVPLTILFAVIWTFSRLHQDNEITALRSCGVHLHTITAPIVLLGVIVTAIMLMMFDRVIPLAHQQKTELLRRTVVSRINRIRAGDSNRLSFGRYEIFVRSIGLAKGEDGEDEVVLEDVIIYQLRSSGDMAPQHRFVAPQAKVIYDEVTGIIVLRLMDGHDLIFENEDASGRTGGRAFRHYVLDLPLDPSEVDRARALVNGAGQLDEVEFMAGTIFIGGSGDADDPEQLGRVRVLARAAADELRCDQVSVRAELAGSPRLLLTLLDEDSARRRSDGDWGHVFERSHEIPLDAAAAKRWNDRLVGLVKGEALDLEDAGVALSGQVVGRGDEGQIILGDASVGIQPPPIEVRAATARATLAKSVTGAPVLRLGLGRGTAAGRRGWGASPQRLDFRNTFDLRLSLDLGTGKRVKLSDMPFADLYRAYLTPRALRVSGKLKDSRVLTEIHYRYALAFASLFFVLVGAPAAMMFRTTSRMAAFGITLLKVFLLYFPAVLGTKALCSSGLLDEHPQWIPVVLWSGNVVFGGLGALYFSLLHRR